MQDGGPPLHANRPVVLESDEAHGASGALAPRQTP
jgi:hypothetical protein